MAPLIILEFDFQRDEVSFFFLLSHLTTLSCIKSDGAVVNPTVLNIVTGQSIRILTTLTPGQVIEIYRTTTDKLAVKRTEDGTEENIFSLLDEDSDLLELAPGDNLLKATADSGETSLQVTVRFYPMVSGILPEVIS